MSAVEESLRAGRARAIADILAFCAIPSVSTDPAYADGIAEAARFLADRMRRAGFPKVEVIATGGHPAVFCEWCETEGAPTILVYGHYDVQPPDPLGDWKTPPFMPDIREGRIYARGVSDDKAPLLMPIFVAEAYAQAQQQLPVNLKILIEGEEETGSPHFEQLVAGLGERLACDAVVSADGAMWRPDLPSVIVACRGLVALDVTVEGAGKDLHSGRHGGSAPNPIAALVQMLASLHDTSGKVAVPGFYAGALAPDRTILEAMRLSAFETGAYFDDIGAKRPNPLPSAQDLLTRQWLEPTLEFNGIAGGYAGTGSKTIIPASAGAKITCRLVAGQVPEAVAEAVRNHLFSIVPDGVRLRVEDHGPGIAAFAVAPEAPVLGIVEDVLEEILGRRPLRVAMGATVPVGIVLKRLLGVETVFFSFSTADEDYHSPNEFFRLSSLEKGLVAWSRLFNRLGQMT